MIDWDKSAKMNNCGIGELKVWFGRFPSSSKLVWWVCDGGCGAAKEKRYILSNTMCKSCTQIQYNKDNPDARKERGKRTIQHYIDHPEAREAARLKTIEQFSNPAQIEAASARTIQYNKDNPDAGKDHGEWLVQYYIDHPEARELARLKTIAQFSNRESRDEMSEIVKNSKAHNLSVEKTRGGNDIVNHHWLYDDADLSKYTMPMTRSEHTKMHWRMRKDGYEVPHINSETDDNGLWGYNAMYINNR